MIICRIVKHGGQRESCTRVWMIVSMVSFRAAEDLSTWQAVPSGGSSFNFSGCPQSTEVVLVCSLLLHSTGSCGGSSRPFSEWGLSSSPVCSSGWLILVFVWYLIRAVQALAMAWIWRLLFHILSYCMFSPFSSCILFVFCDDYDTILNSLYLWILLYCLYFSFILKLCNPVKGWKQCHHISLKFLSFTFSTNFIVVLDKPLQHGGGHNKCWQTFSIIFLFGVLNVRTGTNCWELSGYAVKPLAQPFTTSLICTRWGRWKKPDWSSQIQTTAASRIQVASFCCRAAGPAGWKIYLSLQRLGF